MTKKNMYTCAVCGKSYDAIEDRVNCESKCLAELKKVSEEKKKNEYEAKRRESEKAICRALGDVNEMMAEHFATYNSLSIHKNYPYINYVCGKLPWVF